MHWHREHSFSKLGNECPPRFQTNQLHTCMMLQSGSVRKQLLVYNTENCFIVIRILGEWHSHKHGKLFTFYLKKIKAWIYDNPSYLLRSGDYEVIEMIKSHQSLWKVYRIGLYRDATSLTYIYSILTTSQIVLFCKVLPFFFLFYKRNVDAFYMNTTNRMDMLYNW